MLAEADDIELTEAEIAAEPRVYADGWVPSADSAMAQPQPQPMPQEQHSLPEPLMAAEKKVERRVVSTPWLAAGAALGFGFLVAKMLRR
jgi:hypothetical protein